VGFKGKAGAGGLYALLYGDTVTVWQELCPCLNPPGSTGKRPGDPERSGAALRPFNLCLCPTEEREKNRAIGVK
jgi:hypothetical protein